MSNRTTYKMIVEFVLRDGKRYRLSDVSYADGKIHGNYLPVKKRTNGRPLITSPVPVSFDRSEFVRARLFRDVDGSYPFGRPKRAKAKRKAAA